MVHNANRLCQMAYSFLNYGEKSSPFLAHYVKFSQNDENKESSPVKVFELSRESAPRCVDGAGTYIGTRLPARSASKSKSAKKGSSKIQPV